MGRLTPQWRRGRRTEEASEGAPRARPRAFGRTERAEAGPRASPPRSVPREADAYLLLLLAAALLALRGRGRGRCRAEAGSAAAPGSADPLLRHAVITGGSSGIGLALARELAVRRGCRRVTLLARGMGGLKKARAEIEKELDGAADDGGDDSDGSKVDVRSLDVTDPADVLRAAEEICAPGGGRGGPPTLLFNVAGTSSSGRIGETDPAEFRRLMEVNYLGTAHVCRAFLPRMMEEENDRRRGGPQRHLSTLVLTSSAAGQVGVYGYSAYAPTKAALKCLGEVLAMESKGTPVSVQVVYPPDTDTEGYRLEQVGKPRETHLISEAAGLFRAEDVARRMADAALAPSPPHQVHFGLEGWMLATLTAGMGPAGGTPWYELLGQALLMGPLRLVGMGYLWSFGRIVERCRREREEERGKGAAAAAAAEASAADASTAADAAAVAAAVAAADAAGAAAASVSSAADAPDPPLRLEGLPSDSSLSELDDFAADAPDPPLQLAGLPSDSSLLELDDSACGGKLETIKEEWVRGGAGW